MRAKSAPKPVPKKRAVAAPVPEPVPEPREFRSEGHRLFLDVTGTCQEIGDRIGVSKNAINTWQIGSFAPNSRQREKLAAAFGIPATAWDRLPLGALPPVTPATPDRELGDDDDSDDDDAAAGDDAEQDDGDHVEPSIQDDYRRQLRALRKQLENPALLTRDRLAISDAFSKVLERRRKYERETEMLEDRIIREHPKWRRLKRVIMDALLPHAAAARDVGAAIESVLGEEV